MAALTRPRLLALRALGLGDLLTGVPALRALRRAFLDHEVVLAAPRALEPLVALSAAVDRVVDVRGLAPVPWHGGPPEVAVNLHGRGPQTHELLDRLTPRRLVAFGTEEAGHAGPTWRGDEHERARWCRLLREDLGIEADPADLRLPFPAVPPDVRGAVVVHAGAAFPTRQWPVERFAAVARWAADSGHPVLLTGSPEEAELADRVRRDAGLPAETVLAGRTDVASLAALVAGARLVVCGDTGVAHLASAFVTPSVVLFGPTPPAWWGPPPTGPHAAIWHGDRPGDPWANRPDPALLEIGVEEVLAQAERVMTPASPSVGR